MGASGYAFQNRSANLGSWSVHLKTPQLRAGGKVETEIPHDEGKRRCLKRRHLTTAPGYQGEAG